MLLVSSSCVCFISGGNAPEYASSNILGIIRIGNITHHAATSSNSFTPDSHSFRINIALINTHPSPHLNPHSFSSAARVLRLCQLQLISGGGDGAYGDDDDNDRPGEAVHESSQYSLTLGGFVLAVATTAAAGLLLVVLLLQLLS